MLTVVVDTREQHPYEFGEGVAVVRRALPAGDYSVKGRETEVALERKSLQDFVNTVIHNRTRFTEELKRLSRYSAACVVVEASVDDVLKRRYRGGAHPNSILGLAASIVTDWRIPVYWCGPRHIACWFALEWLRGAERWDTGANRKDPPRKDDPSMN